MRTIALCFSGLCLLVSCWIYVESNQWNRWYLVGASILLSATFSILFISSLPPQPKPSLLLRYAYNFDHYRGSSSATAEEQVRVIDPSIPIKLSFVPNKPIQFVFGIGNETPAVPLEDIYFNLFFRLTDNLVVTAPKEPYGQWETSIPNHHYLIRLPAITNMALNAPSIMVTFPQKGTYEFESDIRVKGLADGVKTKFKVVLY